MIADLVAELGPLWQARRDAAPLDRPRRRAVGAGAKYKVVFVDRLLATAVHLRHGITHDVLACWFQVDRSTITRAVGEMRPLLADRGCRIEGGLRLRTLTDVIAHLGATGQTALMDATEIRVRRPSAHRGGRSRFVSGKSRINAMNTYETAGRCGLGSAPRIPLRRCPEAVQGHTHGRKDGRHALLAIVEDDLHANDRHFRTLDGIVLDTSDDMCGELNFTVFAAIAKFQRQQIVKGTREGFDAARARGQVGGRPRAVTSGQITDARILLGAGQTRTAVAAKLRVSRWTLSRALDTASR
ncbi:transposase family protein [Streptomyces beijiangensis]|uniref:Transposase family protein n=1 Tax=Streptomyces beijiangensis TaxID=163361 RepID=A0A939F8Y9_9ACTN|nr:transposase family protein [Streptomyces beijiangensis]MBO0513743.1 transposase family protein [Streptomyces beijiangensis]